VMEAVVAVLMAVMAVPAVPPAPAVRRVRHDRDSQDGENEEERADHTALRSPEAARCGRTLAGPPSHAPEGSAGRQPDVRAAPAYSIT